MPFSRHNRTGQQRIPCQIDRLAVSTALIKNISALKDYLRNLQQLFHKSAV